MRPSAGATRLCSSLAHTICSAPCAFTHARLAGGRLAPPQVLTFGPVRPLAGGSAGADEGALGVLRPRVADETLAMRAIALQFALRKIEIGLPCATAWAATGAARSNCDFSRASAVASAACACCACARRSLSSSAISNCPA